MKDSEIARKAARKVARKNWFSCGKIDESQTETYKNYRDLADEYKSIFSPKKRTVSPFWLHGELPVSEMHNWRILALLFFAEILESEGR